MEINEIMNALSTAIERNVGKYESFRSPGFEKPICVFNLLQECYSALDSIQQENTVLKNMQRQLVVGRSDVEIGEMLMRAMGK
jgi:hypothetical protein